MTTDILFTGLLLFDIVSTPAKVTFVKVEHRSPRVEVIDSAGVKSEIPINSSIELVGIASGKIGTTASFNDGVPSISALANKVSLDPKLKTTGLISMILGEGEVSAREGTAWCKFTTGGGKSAGYGLLYSVVRWKGKATEIKIDGKKVISLKGAREVLIANDVTDSAHAGNHFGRYFDVLDKVPSPEARPVPCADQMAMVMEAVQGAQRERKNVDMRLTSRGNPLFCPPAQQ